VLGQDGALLSLQKLIDSGKIPHAILLSGPSGCGKTTIARILKTHLSCGDTDYNEVDCAVVESPLDIVRNIQRSIRLSPMSGPCRIQFLEEAQSLSRAGFSQQAMLKMLEDVPEHAYFILATTDPDKLHAAIRTRCTEIKLVALKEPALKRVIERVLNKENLTISEQVMEDIIEAADGSARKALVILEQVVGLETEAEQLAAIQATSFSKADAFKLAQALFNWSHKTTWGEIAALLRLLGAGDAEGIRYVVLGYARSCLVGKDDKAPNKAACDKAFKIIDIFGRNFYDSKHAGLAAACWEAHNNL
jgi:DNA polymerase-3 subunit gamma/tau